MCRRPYSCANLALGHGRAGGESQQQGKKSYRDVLVNTTALPANAVSHHRRGKRETRIEHRRGDQINVNMHERQGRDGRGVSGLLPPSRLHIGKNRFGRRETEEGEYSVWDKRRVGRRRSDARKVRRRMKFPRADEKIRPGARARSA